MNLALHGFLLQVFVSILNFHHGRLLCSAGEPGYLDFDNLPETNFSCQGKVIGGYYADVEAGCQMFHVCTIGQKDEIMDIKFLCLNGTVFDQETRVCERVDEVDCSKSERFYNLNLELYGNNAVTLSLHENGDDEDDLSDPVEDHQSRTTSARPSTTSTTSTTTSRPSKPSTTAASGSYQHPAGYPQHYQPQPPFPQVHTSQSKALYDDKNGGYHHQYIFHNGGERVNDQATSYQLFSNQGAVSSTTVSPPPPQIHQIRYSSTVGPPPQIIHNEPSTVTPLFHATSSTIQTLLNSNGNGPTALINPIFHNHGIASTTEQFTVHSNNPRETTDYRDEDDQEQDIRPLQAIQSISKGKISKLTISPVPSQQESSRTVTKTSQTSQQQKRIPGNFLPTPASIETTVRSFYPTPRPSPKPSQSSQSVTHHVTQHVHVPGLTVPQLKPHQITINLPPPDIQRIIQNPSPLLPSQSRVIVTAKASVSDESGRPLNTTQLVTLPLPTIPASYDDYKEGDESFDPFYRDVPKIRKNHQIGRARRKRSLGQPYHYVYGVDDHPNLKITQESEEHQNKNDAINQKNAHAKIDVTDYQALKESLTKFKDILFNDEVVNSFRDTAEEIKSNAGHIAKDNDAKSVKQAKDNAISKSVFLEDLKTEASKHLNLDDKEEDVDEDEEEEDEESSRKDSFSHIHIDTEKSFDKEKHIKDTSESKSEIEINFESTTAHSEKNEPRQGDIIDVIILDSENDFKSTSENPKIKTFKTGAPIEIIIEEETKSGSHDVSKTDEKVVNIGQVAGYLIKHESEKQSSSIDDEKHTIVPQETTKRKNGKDSKEEKSDSRRKSSRVRSSRRRISSRIKQQRTENKAANVEVAEAIPQKEEIDKPISTTSTTTVTPSTTTATTTTSTTTTSTTTTTPLITAFEAKVAEQIDSHIFEEPESQTSKAVDTRAVGQHDAMYSKSLRDGKSHDASKSKEMERSFDHQIMDDRARNLEKRVDKATEKEQKAESTDSSLEDTNFTENPVNPEAAESMEVTHISEEKSSSDEEFSSFKEYETLDEDESNPNTNDDGSVESTGEVPNKISSHEVTSSHEDNSEQEESFSYEESEKSNTDDFDEEEHSTVKYSEEMNDEELNEYQDAAESSAENAGDTNVQEDYKETENTEDPTTSVDYLNYEEYIDYHEDVADSTARTEDVTEGVLKFTDELPKSDDDAEMTEESEYEETGANDYVDDNYEPKNYKEMETATKSYDLKEEKSEEDSEEKKDAAAKDLDLDLRKKDIETHGVDDRVETETQTEYVEDVTEIVNLKEVASLTTTASTTTMAATTTASPTSLTTTTTTTTTTSRPMTTTPRATPPKLFKPIGARKIYAYVPPTTTPVPVVIKPRMGLYNPKPAKPPKSYNELAPKPVIRKHPFLSRKPTTATTTTTTSTTEKLNTEDSETTTLPMTTIDLTMMTTTTTEKPTTTTTMTTMMTTTTPTPMPTTTMMTTTTTTTTTMKPMTTATTKPTTTATTTTTTESGRSEENILESKLEANEPISLHPIAKSDQTDKQDQLPSPSEHNSPVNSSEKTDPRITIEKIETFTPYPLSRLSTLALSSAEQTTEETQTTEVPETTESIDVLETIVPPTTMFPEKSHEYAEESTDEYPEEIVETTMAPTEDYQAVTEIASILPEHSTLVSTIPTTVQFKAEDADSVASTESANVRPNKRRIAAPRKQASFNCLEKEMYRFYGDTRDCRLFHYCSPGFTSRQVLDFRFVCEEGTAFDEETQSCRHDVRNRMCRNRSW